MKNYYFDTHIYKGGFIWVNNGYAYCIDSLKPNLELEGQYYLIPEPKSLTKIIHPLNTEPNLYNEFASLLPTPENIQSFTCKHGDLTKNIIAPTKNFVSSHQLITGTSLNDWRESILDMFWLKYLFDKLISEDYLFLQSCITHKEEIISIKLPLDIIPKPLYFFTRKNSYANSCLIIKNNGTQIFEFFKQNQDNVEGIVKHGITLELNKLIYKNSTSQVVPTIIDGKINYIEFNIPNNLLTGMYLQMRSDIHGERDLKCCIYCGKTFVVNRKDQLYCPEFIEVIDWTTGDKKNVPSGKHCKKYDFRLTKPKVLDMYKIGKTIEEISRELKRNPVQIMRWLNNPLDLMLSF
jgi:hypothetical protein